MNQKSTSWGLAKSFHIGSDKFCLLVLIFFLVHFLPFIACWEVLFGLEFGIASMLRRNLALVDTTFIKFVGNFGFINYELVGLWTTFNRS